MKLMKLIWKFLIFKQFLILVTAITMEQLEQTMDMLRSVCAPKFNLSQETLDNLRIGIFNDENNKDIKCYMKCVAQTTGVLSRKGKIILDKSLAQINIVVPVELQQSARDGLNKCHGVQKNYKDSCDKVFYLSKCLKEFDPVNYKFP